MKRHAFVAVDTVEGVEFSCVCGVRGTYADVKHHIAESSDASRTEAATAADAEVEAGVTIDPARDQMRSWLARDEAAIERVATSRTPTPSRYGAPVVITSRTLTPNRQAAPIAEDFGGDTMAHYRPIEPREPAQPAGQSIPIPSPPAYPSPPCRSRGCLAPLNSAGLCTVHFREVVSAVLDEPDQVTPPELPPPPPSPIAAAPSIAELFQTMLRQAFVAGEAAAASGESFEIWYQREVLS